MCGNCESVYTITQDGNGRQALNLVSIWCPSEAKVGGWWESDEGMMSDWQGVPTLSPLSENEGAQAGLTWTERD